MDGVDDDDDASWVERARCGKCLMRKVHANQAEQKKDSQKTGFKSRSFRGLLISVEQNRVLFF